jgi:hypothetical protein
LTSKLPSTIALHHSQVISYSAATHCCALASSWQHAVQTAAGRGADADGHDGRGRRGPVPCNAAINACEILSRSISG